MLAEKKILIFENKKENHWVLKEIFEGNKMIVQITSETINLMHEIMEFSPDLMLIDVNLDTYDGRTLCYHLKKTPQTKGIPIIMMSENQDINMMDGVLCEADHVIQNPFVVKDLLSTMKILINKKSQ